MVVNAALWFLCLLVAHLDYFIQLRHRHEKRRSWEESKNLLGKVRQGWRRKEVGLENGGLVKSFFEVETLVSRKRKEKCFAI